MSFGHPAPAADAARDPGGDRALPARRAAPDALRGPLHERRRARRGRRGGPPVAALADGGGLPARARDALRGASHGRTCTGRGERQRDRRARARRVGLDAGAVDVKPTRLVAAQRALHTFLDKVPSRLKVGLVALRRRGARWRRRRRPTTSSSSQAIDNAGFFRGFGGTAIGDAIATAVQVGLRSAGVEGKLRSALQGTRSSRRTSPPRQPAASTLVSILFLSDGTQTRGNLQPLAGCRAREAAGMPVYTVALGTPATRRMRGYPARRSRRREPGRRLRRRPRPRPRRSSPDPTTLPRANARRRVLALGSSSDGAARGHRPGRVRRDGATRVGPRLRTLWAPRHCPGGRPHGWHVIASLRSSWRSRRSVLVPARAHRQRLALGGCAA